MADELLDGARLVARVNAFRAWERARRDFEASRAHLDSVLGECSGFCPAGYAGHWRDWHKGHGCEVDIRGNVLSYEREISVAASPEPAAPVPVEPVVTDGFGAPILVGGTYLISDDRSRDNVIWWNPKSAGYTVSLDRAGRYSGEEAAHICRRTRSGGAPQGFYDIPMAWPVERIIGDLVCRVVSVEALLKTPAEVSRG